jgi:hypothetical protein
LLICFPSCAIIIPAMSAVSGDDADAVIPPARNVVADAVILPMVNAVAGEDADSPG